MLGSRTPVQRSRKRSTDVWSKASPAAQPPTVHGETIRHGTRKPPPMGRPFTNSSLVPAGGTGGGTWSKRPSFSSKLRMKTVFRHTSGLSAIASSFFATKSAPAAGSESGCSQPRVVGRIHETAGSRSLRASSSKVPSGVRRIPRSYSALPGLASLNCWNCSSMFVP